MPVFSKQLKSLDSLSDTDAIRSLANHVRVLQEELEYRLMFLDSSNISEIDSGVTSILTKDGNLNVVLDDMEGNHAELKFSLEGLTSVVQSQAGDISSLEQRADSIQMTVQNQAGDISKLQQTADSITTTVQNQAGDISALQQTADSLLLRVSGHDGDIASLRLTDESIQSTVKDQAGDISQLTQRADSIDATVQSQAGDISSLRLTAESIQATVEGHDGDIASLKLKDDEILATVQGQAGDISSLEQRADSITSTVQSQGGDISQLQQTATSMQSTIQSQAGDISSLQQTATSLTSTIQSHDGSISQLSQTVDGLSSTVQSQDGSISQLSQRVDSIQSTVEGYDGQISQITQRADSIEASVGDLETGLGNTVRLASDGVTITNAAGSTLTIDGGQINADTLNLTGRITFDDMGADWKNEYITTTMTAADANTNATDAIGRADSALSGLQLMANGQYSGGTFIDNKNIYGPNLYGDTINLLDGNSRLVGTMSLQYSSTFAFDITSELSLRMNAAYGYNAYIGTSGGPYLQLADGICKLGGGMFAVEWSSWGSTLPTATTPGQVYFLVS